MKSSTHSALILSTALLFGGSAATLAAPTLVGEVATKTVRFADLDISTASGAEALYERIVTAARMVCRDAGLNLVAECRARAIADAVRGVASPLLSSVHSSTIERVEEVVRR
jgi:UrcA family protein